MHPFLKKLKDAMAEVRNRIAEAVKGLPDGDQLVVDGPVQTLISDQNWALKRLAEAVELFSDDEEMTALAQSFVDQALEEGRVLDPEKKDEILAAMIEEKGLLTPEQRDAEVNAAREEEKQTAADALAAAEKIAAGRAAAVEAHGPALLAMKDEDFLAEDHEARVALFAGRLARLAEIGITPDTDKETVEVYCSHPLDEDGEKTVQAMFKVALAGRATGDGGEGEGGESPKPKQSAQSGSRSALAGALSGSEGGEPSDPPKKKPSRIFV